MSELGMGAMLYQLGGGSDESADKYYGKTIQKMEHLKEKDALNIYFTDGTTIQITDEGQSCCEYRYMTIDDKLDMLDGEVLKDIKVDYTETEDEHDTHEIAFIHIKTNRDSMIISTHNEHNGYYGGFGLNIKEIKS